MGTTSLAFSDGITLTGGAGRIWGSTGLSWTAGTDVSVRLISLTAPGAPTGLAATANGPSQIDLSWSAPASTGGSAITGYKIEVSANGTSGWTDQVANTNSTATTYAHTGLGAGDTRHYRVSAINANGTGVPSNVDSATTGTTVPGAPTGLTATASGTTAINLSWSAPASTGGSAITGYKIEVSANGTSGWTDQVANTNSTATTYAHTGLVSGDTRHYRVSAINANGTGVPSNVDSATTGTTVPGAPTGLTATASGTTAINLSWSAPATTGGSAITGYKIEVSPNGTSGWTDQVANTNSTATTYAHTGLGAGDTRHYRVSAINANGTGVPSNVDSATTASTNTAAMGAPTITGTAQVGQTLTAATTGITDADGLTSPTYTYQWIRVDGTDEEDISGENSSTYTLIDADLGKTIKVKVSFTDDASNSETLTSAAYPSSGTVTAASTTAPALLSVTVTSTPHKTTDTYGAREHIEFSMTFDAPVTVTGDPTFAFDLGGATTATYYAGSGTATLRFSHAVSGGSSGDEDTNGISWAANAIALNGGTIAGTGNAVAAVLTHVAQSDLEEHKVDGRTTAVTPATVTVAVTSTPTSLADTYGFGETIVITVTASEAVEVEGDPEFEFSMNNPGESSNPKLATYDRTRSTAMAMAFAYTVQAGDEDSDGIWIGSGSSTFVLDVNDRIRTASQQIDIDRSHPEKGTLAGHKVNGSLGAPTVPPDPTAPTLVSATATTLTIEWTHPGDGGSPLTRNFIEYRVEGTTDWTNWYRGETPTPVTRTVIRNLAAATAYDVRVHSTNAIGNSQWTQSATAFSTLAGTAATGAPTITGTAAVGQPLAVDLTGIEDADGLTNVSYSYQWVRVDADGMSNPADITDATDATYTLVDADLGKTLKVRVTFDDDGGSTETLTSAATATVTPAAGAPNSPRNLSATVGVGQVVLVWQHSQGLGGGTRSHYEYRSSAGAMISPDAMWQQASSSPGFPNTAYYQVVKGLTSGTTHTFQVRAVNPQGGSAPATVTATPLSQPSCTIDELGDRRLLWQGQLVAAVQRVSTDGSVSVGNSGGVETGTLTPAAVTFRSTTYSVITWTSDDRLYVVLRDEDTVWYPREEVVDALRWHVCNTPYDFSSATPADGFSTFSGYRWNVDSNWPPGIERTLRLSLPPNHPATGDPVISGTVQVGEELTALTDGIMDDDVLDDVFTYQWVRVDADGTSNEEDITDETDATYTLTADERGKKVKVEVRFVDILGGEETRTSAPTATLAGTPNTAATGAPTITGTAQVGQTLTAVDHGHHGCGRADQPHLHVPVDPGGRHGRGGHCEREFEHLPPGRRRPGQDPQGAGDLRRRPRPYRDAHQRGDGDGGRGSDRPPDGERCGGHVNAGLGHHLLPRGRGHRIHRDVQRPGDGDRHTEVRVQAGRGDAAGRLRERLGQRGVGVRPDGAGRRGRSQRHLVECDRARPRRRDHHADGRDDGREPDPRRAGAAGGAPGGRRPADAGLGVGAWDVAGAGLRRAARSGLDAGDGRVYGDGDGRSHHHEPGGVGGVDIRHLGDAGTGRGAGCGRDGDAGVRAAGVEPGAGRGGQRCAGVQRPVGEAGPAAAAGP